MTDHDALLRAICENPAEDTPRLVFADWLDEHADEFPTPAAVRSRAAFIRDDVGMSQRDEFDPLRLRWELIEKPKREAEPWVKETLPAIPNGCEFVRGPLLRRGFPWGVELAPQSRGGKPEPPVNSFPLECVCFRGWGYSAVTMLHNAAWRRSVAAVEFQPGEAGPVGVRRLLQVPDLDRLSHLAFGDPALAAPYAVNTAEVRELVESRLFQRIECFRLSRAPVGTAVAGALTRLDSCGLRRLQLTACRMRSESLTALLDSEAGGRLQSLSIGGDLGGRPEKLRGVARVTRPLAIRSLDLTLDTVNEGDLEAFLVSGSVAGLRRLNLSHCSLSGDRARLLATGGFKNLRALYLASNPVGNEGAAAIARSPHLAGLLVLDLAYAQVGDEGILAILESPPADGLAFLNLSGSPASAETKELLKAKMGDRVLL